MEKYIIAVIGSGALSALISGLFMLLESGRRKESGERKALRLIMYRSIKEDARVYIGRGISGPMSWRIWWHTTAATMMIWAATVFLTALWRR